MNQHGTVSRRVSIGLPVYNGENYLRQAVDSLLAQTFQDFELIISDNASTDATEQICREYAYRDSRVRYVRNERNIGGSENFNRVFELSGDSEYFKWSAHDDVCAPDFLLKCVEVLDKNPSVVLAYPKARNMNKDGVIREEVRWPRGDSSTPQERFGTLMGMKNCYPVFGLMRTSALKKTTLHGKFPGSDKILLARLSLLGQLLQVPEVLFFRRIHAEKSVRAFPSYHSRFVWFDPEMEGKIVFPRFKLCGEYFAAISDTPLTYQQKIGCYYQVLRRFRWFGLSKDIGIAAMLLFRRSSATKPVVNQAKSNGTPVERGKV
jgi:glycosyltransferase involved in cell wall biosynthesis